MFSRTIPAKKFILNGAVISIDSLALWFWERVKKDMNTNQENLVRKMVRSFRSSWKTGISSSVDKELHDYECKHFISCYLYGRYYLGNTTKWKHFIIYSGLLSVSLKPSNCWLLTSFMRIPLLNRTLDQILFSIALAQSPFLVAESPWEFPQHQEESTYKAGSAWCLH